MKQIFGPWRQCGTVAVVSHGSRRRSEMVCGQPEVRLWVRWSVDSQRPGSGTWWKSRYGACLPALGAAQAGGKPPCQEELGLPKGAALLYKDQSS